MGLAERIWSINITFQPLKSLKNIES
jgi:hypothetical protein